MNYRRNHIDYAYTLQGLLKDINGYRVDINSTGVYDIGEDGSSTNYVNKRFGRDLFSSMIQYYQTDYSPIIDIGSSSYQYDALGNLIRDNNENINVTWNLIGKVKSVQTPNNLLSFAYNPIGQRQIKRTPTDSTYYVYDATGNVMSIYIKDYPKITAKERPIYGSSRLGIMNKEVEFNLTGNFLSKSNSTIGIKEYELCDHLNNVSVVVLDRKDCFNSVFKPIAKTYTDYYPFGYPISFRTDNVNYRYGYNGQEKDNEVYGNGSIYTAEFWQYDSRLGRRWNVDPMLGKYNWQSPYSTFNNNPICFNDPIGLEGEDGNKDVKKHTILSGETLSGIAKQYNTSVETLAKWNNITDVNKIIAGHVLIVSDTSRPSNYKSFESYPPVKEATGWTSSSSNIREITVNNLSGLVQASLSNYNIANLGGQLLSAVQNDPDMVAYQNEILNKVKSDPRYGKEAFYLSGFDVRGFGGKRGSGDDWFRGGKNDPILKKETWKVAENQLTWALRNATVKYWAEIGVDGTITIQYKLYDILDLSGSKGRSNAYNGISNGLGFIYHTLLGGNKNIQIRTQWKVTK